MKCWWLSGCLTAIFLLAVTLSPLVALMAQTHESAIAIWQDAYLCHLVLFSLKQALLSMALSLGIAIPFAHTLFHHTFFGKKALLHLFGLSQVLPVIIALFGLVAIHGAQGWLAKLAYAVGISSWPDYLFGLSGILLAHVFFNMPLATRWLSQSLESIPENYWRQAQQLGMTRWQAFVWLEWPAMRRLIPGLASLIFMLCFTSFTIVMALGGGPQATTLEVAIYQALRFDFDLAAAGQLASWQLGLGLLVVIAYQWMKPEYLQTQMTQSASRCNHPWHLLDIAMVCLGCFIFLPPVVAVFGYGVSGLMNLENVSSMLWPAFRDSIMIAFASGGIALVLSLLLIQTSRKLLIQHHQKLVSQCLTGTGSLILLLPTSVLSTGLFILLQDDFDLFSYGMPIVILLNALAALPYTIRALQHPMEDVFVRYQRLSQSLGMSWYAKMLLVEWPLLSRTIGRTFALGMIFSLGDLAAIAMFGSDELKTLPWLLYQQLGHYQMDAAAVTALILLSLCLFLLWFVEHLAIRSQSTEPPSLLES